MNRAGFTLLELSIVIVIIGLIVAGISAGQSIVKQASIRSALQQYKQYNTAYNSFFLQYDQLPGDMSNAYSYWGTACDSDPDYCNGNNDGTVSNSLSEAIQAQESVRAWQHMSLSGILSETYTAERDSDLFPVPGAGVPESAYYGNDGEGPTTWDLFTGGMRMSGWVHWPTNEYRPVAHSDAVTTNDAYLMDVKIDDGIRTTGKVTASNGKRDIWYWNAYCVSGSDPSGYNVGYDQNACSMVFLF